MYPEVSPGIEIDYIEPAGYVGRLYLTTDLLVNLKMDEILSI